MNTPARSVPEPSEPARPGGLTSTAVFEVVGIGAGWRVGAAACWASVLRPVEAAAVITVCREPVDLSEVTAARLRTARSQIARHRASQE